jgi:hypothetical protein
LTTSILDGIDRKLAIYERTRRKGVDFLLANLHPDGSLNDIRRPRVTYYRLPWALQLAGETAAAFRALDWIAANALGDDGAFHGDVAWDPRANRVSNTYAETCLAYGAVLLRRFDIAHKAFRFAKQFQDAGNGGVFMIREQCGPDGPQQLFLTCQFGMSAVITGDLAAAMRVGEWLDRLWSAQPDLPARLYTVTTPRHGLALSVPESEDARHYVDESQEVRQMHYNGGIAAAFLAHLHLATGAERWLNLAEHFQRFSMESTERQFETKQVCKSAWGGGLLYLITREQRYLPWLIRMGDWFTQEQEPDGRWSNSRYIEANPPLSHQIETTAEFVVHMDTLIGALSVAARRG